MRKRRKTPDHGTNFIKIHVDKRAQTRMQDAGSMFGADRIVSQAQKLLFGCLAAP